jgi:TM2 domain-containing membrane protein YozV
VTGPKKSPRTAYVLLLLLGLIGAHRFYLGRTRTGVATLLLTLAGVTVFSLAVLVAVVWLIVDAFLIPGWIRQCNGTAGLPVDHSGAWRALRWGGGVLGAGFAGLLLLAAILPEPLPERVTETVAGEAIAPMFRVGQGKFMGAGRGVSTAPQAEQATAPPRYAPSKKAPAVPALPTGMARIDGDAIGCSSREVFDQLTRLQVDGDAEAAKWYLLAGMAHGECRVFYDGDIVYLADTALFSGLAAVRPRGEVGKFWTNMERVKTR